MGIIEVPLVGCFGGEAMTNKMMDPLTLYGELGGYVRHIGAIFHPCKILSVAVTRAGKHKIEKIYQPHFWG